MGIYIQSFGGLRKNAGPLDPSRVEEAAQRWAEARGLGPLFYSVISSDCAWVSFYPPCGGIAFEVNSEKISFDAKTSIAGPGYHVALISFCDHLAQELGIDWRWDAGGDDTGYALGRDREGLSQAFVEQFDAFCDFYRSNNNEAELHVLNLEEGLALGGHRGVATLMGELSLEGFLAREEGLGYCPENVFPWWNDAIDADFWKRTLFATLWGEVEWRQARTPWEKHVHAAALNAAERAGSNEAAIALAELRAIQSRASNVFLTPDPGGIGWRKRPRGFFMPGPWRITLPGHYIESLEDEGNTKCLWFGDEEIRASSFTLSLKPSAEIGWGRDFQNEPESIASTHRFRLNPRVKKSSTDGFWIAFAECQTIDAKGVGHLLVLSLLGNTVDLLPRLSDLAGLVWFDPPKPRLNILRDA